MNESPMFGIHAFSFFWMHACMHASMQAFHPSSALSSFFISTSSSSDFAVMQCKVWHFVKSALSSRGAQLRPCIRCGLALTLRLLPSRCLFDCFWILRPGFLICFFPWPLRRCCASSLIRSRPPSANVFQIPACTAWVNSALPADSAALHQYPKAPVTCRLWIFKGVV